MPARSLHRRLNALRWHRLSIGVESTRVLEPETQAHPLVVFEAVVKGVADACGFLGNLKQPFYHLAGRPGPDSIEKGDRFTLEVCFLSWPQGAVERFRAQVEPYLARPERNFALTALGEVEVRSYAAVAEELGPVPEEGELCLEFLTPLPFRRGRGCHQTLLSREEFCHVLGKRLERLVGGEPEKAFGREEFWLLPYYWDFKGPRFGAGGGDGRGSARHRAVTGEHWRTGRPPGGKKKPARRTPMDVVGCQGKLFLRGRFGRLVPGLVLASELHLCHPPSFSRGYFRILPVSTPVFQHLVGDPARLAEAAARVLDERPEAARMLAEDLGGVRPTPENVGARLGDLLRDGRYTPTPSLAVEVKKKEGGVRLLEESRPVDLVVQRHVCDLLREPLGRMFERSSIGYRRGMSRKDAAEAVSQAWRDGCRFVLETDIQDFFPSVDLDKLEGALDRCLPIHDTRLRRLLSTLLRTGRVRDGVSEPRQRGLAQGSALSPMLSNLYLDPFDEFLAARGVRSVRYGDDLIVMTRTREEADALVPLCQEFLSGWGLALHPEKTSVRPMEEGFEYLGLRFEGARESGLDEEQMRRYRKPLYVVEPWLFLGKNGDALQLRRAGKTLATVPLRRLSELVVLGPASLSTHLLGRCAQLKIPVTLATPSGYHQTTIRPDSKAHFETIGRHLQRHEATGETELLVIAKDILRHKLKNYLHHFMRRTEKGAFPIRAALQAALGRIDEAENVRVLRGIEGDAARKCFQALNRLVRDPAFHLKERKKRHSGKPSDPINSLLNLGYYTLFARINATLLAQGLNPYLGFLHSHEDRFESLACDVQELFRADIDFAIVRFLNRKEITMAHFEETEKGQRLTREGKYVYLSKLEAALVVKRAKHDLSVEDRIYVQVSLIKKWVLGQGNLEFVEGRK